MASNSASGPNSPEQEAFLGDAPAAPPKGKLASFCHFLYNRQNGTCLGRTPLSWLEITIFYIIFYAALAGFWIACLAIFMQTLDDKFPRFYGKGTIIGINPGMGYQPWLSDDPDSTLLHINKSNPDSYAKYVDQLTHFLSSYADTAQTRECTGNQSNSDDTELACRFDLSEFESEGCSQAESWGYPAGKPCVVIKLNRLIGWEPVPYPINSAPYVVKDRYNYGNGDIAVNCGGEYYSDQENIGEVKYLPKGGILRKFYPYKVMKNYQQPIAMVKFDSPQLGSLVAIECKAYAYNIIHDRADRQGMVHFELLVDP